MKVNHSAIRSVIRFVVLTAFVSSLMWRIYNIMKFGGKVDPVIPTDPNECDDDCDCACAEPDDCDCACAKPIGEDAQ